MYDYAILNLPISLNQNTFSEILPLCIGGRIFYEQLRLWTV
jgi:hypothetical protein